MRHDFKYSQSHSSAIRQRPDGSIVLPSGAGEQQHNMGYHRKHYHHDNEEHNNNNNNYNRYNKDKYYNSHYSGDVNSQNGADSSGVVVSALSVSHESEKQWEWLEEVLIKSSRNKETVSK